MIYGYFATDMYAPSGIGPGIAAIVAGAALLCTGLLLKKERSGWAFITTGITIIGSTLTIFIGLFPRVMVSSLDNNWSLTIYNASSSQYTLTVMSIVALCFVPLVLVYQSWTYWTFRRRVASETELEY